MKNKTAAKHKSIAIHSVEKRILCIRDKRVMIDHDLAMLYGASTKRLNEQVKRNLERFPENFMFQLTQSEKDEVVAKCDHLVDLKFSSYLPRVFTEHGILMLANVLSSPRAIEMSIKIIEVFVRIREMMLAHRELGAKLKELEQKVGKHDEDIQSIIVAIQQLLAQEEKPKRRMGFHAD